MPDLLFAGESIQTILADIARFTYTFYYILIILWGVRGKKNAPI